MLASSRKCYQHIVERVREKTRPNASIPTGPGNYVICWGRLIQVYEGLNVVRLQWFPSEAFDAPVCLQATTPPPLNPQHQTESSTIVRPESASKIRLPRARAPGPPRRDTRLTVRFMSEGLKAKTSTDTRRKAEVQKNSYH